MGFACTGLPSSVPNSAVRFSSNAAECAGSPSASLTRGCSSPTMPTTCSPADDLRGAAGVPLRGRVQLSRRAAAARNAHPNGRRHGERPRRRRSNPRRDDRRSQSGVDRVAGQQAGDVQRLIGEGLRIQRGKLLIAGAYASRKSRDGGRVRHPTGTRGRSRTGGCLRGLGAGCAARWWRAWGARRDAGTGGRRPARGWRSSTLTGLMTAGIVGERLEVLIADERVARRTRRAGAVSPRAGLSATQAPCAERLVGLVSPSRALDRSRRPG